MRNLQSLQQAYILDQSVLVLSLQETDYYGTHRAQVLRGLRQGSSVLYMTTVEHVRVSSLPHNIWRRGWLDLAFPTQGIFYCARGISSAMDRVADRF